LAGAKIITNYERKCCFGWAAFFFIYGVKEHALSLRKPTILASELERIQGTSVLGFIKKNEVGLLRRSFSQFPKRRD
jgi:hypothetical protein